MIVIQSSATALRPCPSGTFENSPAIYGWVYRPKPIQSPDGTGEVLFCFADLKYRCTGLIACRKSILSKSLCLSACRAEALRRGVGPVLPRRESSQINPAQLKSKPKADQSKPKMNPIPTLTDHAGNAPSIPGKKLAKLTDLAYFLRTLSVNP
jgi:hypothetical protein